MMIRRRRRRMASSSRHTNKNHPAKRDDQNRHSIIGVCVSITEVAWLTKGAQTCNLKPFHPPHANHLLLLDSRSESWVAAVHGQVPSRVPQICFISWITEVSFFSLSHSLCFLMPFRIPKNKRAFCVFIFISFDIFHTLLAKLFPFLRQQQHRLYLYNHSFPKLLLPFDISTGALSPLPA